MRINRILTTALFVIILPSIIAAEEDRGLTGSQEENLVVKTVDGLKFSVPQDRPIEKQKGIVAPMPLDAYVAMKFYRLDERLREMEDSINKIENKLVILEENVKLLKKADAKR